MLLRFYNHCWCDAMSRTLHPHPTEPGIIQQQMYRKEHNCLLSYHADEPSDGRGKVESKLVTLNFLSVTGYAQQGAARSQIAIL